MKATITLAAAWIILGSAAAHARAAQRCGATPPLTARPLDPHHPEVLIGDYALTSVWTSKGGHGRTFYGKLSLGPNDTLHEYGLPYWGTWATDGHVRPLAGSSRSDGYWFRAELEDGVLYLGFRHGNDADPQMYRITAVSSDGFWGTWTDPQTGIGQAVDSRGHRLPNPQGPFCAVRIAPDTTARTRIRSAPTNVVVGDIPLTLEAAVWAERPYPVSPKDHFVSLDLLPQRTDRAGAVVSNVRADSIWLVVGDTIAPLSLLPKPRSELARMNAMWHGEAHVPDSTWFTRVGTGSVVVRFVSEAGESHLVRSGPISVDLFGGAQVAVVPPPAALLRNGSRCHTLDETRITQDIQFLQSNLRSTKPAKAKSWMQHMFPPGSVDSLAAVTDDATCERAALAYGRWLSPPDITTPRSVYVVRVGATRYSVSDSTAHAGKVNLHMVFDSSFTTLLGDYAN